MNVFAEKFKPKKWVCEFIKGPMIMSHFLQVDVLASLSLQSLFFSSNKQIFLEQLKEKHCFLDRLQTENNHRCLQKYFTQNALPILRVTYMISGHAPCICHYCRHIYVVALLKTHVRTSR